MKAHRAQALLLCLSFLTACGSGSFAPGVGGILRSIQINPVSPSVPLGENQQFTATGHYRDGATKDLTSSVAWSSANNTVATISGSGFAASRATGSATITATLSGVSGNGTLIVTNAILVSIAITPANPNVLLGTLQQFTATGTFSDQSTQDITSSVTWSSSNKGVASMGGGGLVTALALGSFTISATSGSISSSTTANVQLSVLTSLAIDPVNGKIAQLTSQQFHATGTYSDGSTQNLTEKVSWTSSNTAAATIATSGRLKGLAPGTTTVAATIGSFTASATLNVTNATIVSISVTPSAQTIAPGTALAFMAIGHFSDSTAQVITIDSIWSSDNPTVAIVGAAGTAVAYSPGTANISATFSGVSSSVPLYVTSATVSAITVTPATAALTPTTSLNFVATATLSDGTTQVITNIAKWTSSDSTVAAVSGGGRVTANAIGSATITAQFGSISGNATILVNPSQLTSLQISPASATIPQQIGFAFLATGTFSDGTTQDLTRFALWTSSAPSVATISAGHAIGLEPGTSTIVALFDAEAGTAQLTVTSATPTSLVISPANTSLDRGSFTRFTAVANFSDGTTRDVTRWVTWTSSDANVAVVTSTGIATSTGGGEAAVTANLNGRTGTAVLQVH